MAACIGIKTILHISLLLQGVSMVLAWVFIDYRVVTYTGKDLQLSIRPLFLGLVMTSGSLIAFKIDKERKDEKRHIFPVVVTVVLLSFNYLCQIGIFNETIIKWNVTEIMVAIFDCVNIIASLVTSVIVLQKPTCTKKYQQVLSNEARQSNLV